MQEPLQYYIKKYYIDISKINKIVCGEKYVGILLHNGNIGVCATLLEKVNITIEDLQKFDLNNIQHRIVFNAYLNALLNYSNIYQKIIDFFEYLDFTKYKEIVMIGHFESLIHKFENENISLTIFDRAIRNEQLHSMSEQIQYVSKADAIILTGTTIFNSTFLDIVNYTTTNCDVFLLGPSNILHQEMFQYKNIKLIFGAIFEKNDEQLLEMIKEGYGTRDFLPYMKKVYLTN